MDIIADKDIFEVSHHEPPVLIIPLFYFCFSFPLASQWIDSGITASYENNDVHFPKNKEIGNVSVLLIAISFVAIEKEKSWISLERLCYLS